MHKTKAAHPCFRALVAVVLAGKLTLSFGADLDAPITPQIPTMRTEIQRGTSAALDCGTRGSPSWSRFSDCVFAVQEGNKQKNTASDSFALGLFFAAWMRASTFADLVKGDGEIGSARGFMDVSRSYFKKTGLELKEFCDAASIRYDVVQPRWQSWGERFPSPR